MFVLLESNPEVMTSLLHNPGLSPTLSLHDVYSLTDPALLSFVPQVTALGYGAMGLPENQAESGNNILKPVIYRGFQFNKLVRAPEITIVPSTARLGPYVMPTLADYQNCLATSFK
ncbi:hypothetical protein V500_03123 [Pseudogymnoascus sp. VKM F-4518 (FW-2643)]|nr:hypothetical protein V500_03123 [Pseudogymnoascus sp. VKM F-4518 (FW-2643)]